MQREDYFAEMWACAVTTKVEMIEVAGRFSYLAVFVTIKITPQGSADLDLAESKISAMLDIIHWIAAFCPSATMRSAAPEADNLNADIAQHRRSEKAQSTEQNNM